MDYHSLCYSTAPCAKTTNSKLHGLDPVALTPNLFARSENFLAPMLLCMALNARNKFQPNWLQLKLCCKLSFGTDCGIYSVVITQSPLGGSEKSLRCSFLAAWMALNICAKFHFDWLSSGSVICRRFNMWGRVESGSVTPEPVDRSQNFSRFSVPV